MRMPAEPVPQGCGYDHGCSTVSRRRFVGMAAGAASAALLSRFWFAALAQAAPMGRPKPIPGGITVPFAKGTFHVFLPEPGKEPSTISDFDGIVGLSVVRGACTKTHLTGGATQRLLYETDMRFMTGRYVGADGKTTTGTFGFV